MCIRDRDYEAFYREEILFRKVNLYPPFCSLLTVQFTSVSEADSHAGARLFARLFTRLAQAEYADLPIRMLGPAGDTLYPVSYTYLDVYKRQSPGRFGRSSPGAPSPPM